jgi:formylglycine-generating enzyme required for sulfatase activity
LEKPNSPSLTKDLAEASKIVTLSHASKTKVSPRDGMVMVFVPAGEFLMGSKADDPYGREDEKPQRSVYLDAFWIDQTEVTNAMYALFLNANGNQIEDGDTWLDADDPVVRVHYIDGEWQPEAEYSHHPVIEVTWFGAYAYCQWAGRRLPTEAEWEKAARGGDGRTYPWGQAAPGVIKVSCQQANIAGCNFDTQPVGSYPDYASPYGILDMSGNLAEWVQDWYQPNYYRIAPDENPPGPPKGEYKVLRGGAWSGGYITARTTRRSWGDPAFTCLYHGEGFRCAASP